LFEKSRKESQKGVERFVGRYFEHWGKQQQQYTAPTDDVLYCRLMRQSSFRQKAVTDPTQKAAVGRQSYTFKI